MINQTQAVTRPNEKAMEFVPFGAADKIRLTIEIIKSLVAVPTRSGKTCSDRDAVKFMMLCQAQRLNPFAGDAFLVGYDGKNGAEFSLITAHSALLKRAEAAPSFKGMLSGVIILDPDSGELTEREGDFHLPNERIVGGWARVYDERRAKETYRRIRMERFNNGFAQWGKDPAGMIVKCAEADALRSTYPTMLGGLYTREEMAESLTLQSAPISEAKALIEALPKPGTIISAPRSSAQAPEPSGASGTVTGTEEETEQSPDVKIIEALEAAGVSLKDFAAELKDAQHLSPADSIGSFDDIWALLMPKQIQTIADNIEAFIASIKEQEAKALKPAATAPAKPKKAAAPVAAEEPAPPAEGEESEVMKALRAAMQAQGVAESQLIAWGKHPRTKKLPEGVNTLAEAAEVNPPLLNFMLSKLPVIKKEIESLKL